MRSPNRSRWIGKGGGREGEKEEEGGVEEGERERAREGERGEEGGLEGEERGYNIYEMR
jgi:hypothetical protein